MSTTILPFDVIVNILHFIPASRSRLDPGSKTLAACLQVSPLIRDAARVSSLWKSHYTIRYEHGDHSTEGSRRHALRNDWRLMYLERRRLDCLALQLLENIIQQRNGRLEHAQALSKLGMDVWDCLELESQCPLPRPFSTGAWDRECGSIPPHPLAHQFWAKSSLAMISRGYAVRTWKPFFLPHPSNRPSFEKTLSTLSCFFSESEQRITSEIDSLASNFHLEAASRGIQLDLAGEGHDLPKLCIEICIFMRARGFGLPSGEEYHDDVMNKFPHAYLTSHKKTIPINLVHIFVSIATRMGINASPINFPGTVLAHVQPPNPEGKPIILNVSSPNAEDAILNFSLGAESMHFSPPNASIYEFLAPCDGAIMLLRSARNILAALMAARRVPNRIFQSAMLLASCVHLLFEADNFDIERLLSNLRLQTLDCAFLLNELAPMLTERCRAMLGIHCRSILAGEARRVQHRRSTGVVKYFVGMGFTHAEYGYRGFIRGWDEVCKADPQWIEAMSVDSLSRGREQPFYNVFADDGNQRYVAEENIRPAPFTQDHVLLVFQKFEEFAVYFEGVQFPKDSGRGCDHADGRGRLFLSPQCIYAYPEDDAIGRQWIEQGTFPLPGVLGSNSTG